MNDTFKILIFYIPCPSESVASDLSNALLDQRLIACSNVISGKSIYTWEEKLNEDSEVFLLAKTLHENENKLEAFINASHPYDLPCIARWEAWVNEAYYCWVKDSCDRNP